MTARFLSASPLAEPRLGRRGIMDPGDLPSPTSDATLLAVPVLTRARGLWEN